VAVWGSVDISVQSRSGVDPYFYFLMSDPPVGWWKEWFFLRNDADVSLPVFIGNRPVPQPNWGYNVDQQHIRKQQPLCDVIRQLL
jgi:hypothetical protein